MNGITTGFDWIAFYNTYLLALVPVLTGIVQVFKTAGLPSRYAPLVALVLGGVIGGAFGYQANDLIRGILAGLALGAVSMGLYDGFQKAINPKVVDLQKTEAILVTPPTDQTPVIVNPPKVTDERKEP